MWAWVCDYGTSKCNAVSYDLAVSSGTAPAQLATFAWGANVLEAVPALLAASQCEAELAASQRQAELAASQRQAELAASQRQAELAASQGQAELAASQRQAELAASQGQAELAAVTTAGSTRRKAHKYYNTTTINSALYVVYWQGSDIVIVYAARWLLSMKVRFWLST